MGNGVRRIGVEGSSAFKFDTIVCRNNNIIITLLIFFI